MPRLMKGLIIAIITFSPSLLMAENLIFYSGAAPLSYTKDNQHKGLYFDIVTAIFDDMEVEYNVTTLPFKRALLYSGEGKGIVVGIYKTKKRSEKLDFSHSFYDSEVVLFVRKTQGFPFLSITDLKGKTIAKKLGWSYGAEFDKAKEQLNFQTINGDPERNFRLVIEGRVDAYIDNRISGIYTIKKMGITDKIEILPHPINIGPHYLGVKKNTHSKLIKRFNKHLKQFKSDGRYKEIISKYH